MPSEPTICLNCRHHIDDLNRGYLCGANPYTPGPYVDFVRGRRRYITPAGTESESAFPLCGSINTAGKCGQYEAPSGIKGRAIPTRFPSLANPIWPDPCGKVRL